MKKQTQTVSFSTGVNCYWLDELDGKQISFMVLDPTNDRVLIEQLQTCPDWVIDFVSEEAIILTRQELSFYILSQL